MTQSTDPDKNEWKKDQQSGIEYRVRGEFAQVLEAKLMGNIVYAQTGRLVWMTGATMTVSSGSGGIGRVFGGGGYFLSSFEGSAPDARIGLSPAKPGDIVPYALDGIGALLCERSSFLAATDGVEVGGTLQRNLGAGVFGGEGLILQKISGRGVAFLSCAGCGTEHRLGSGDTLFADAGHVAFFEDSVSYEVEAVNGVKNFLFGGEGLFLAKLSGPGKVWTQSH